VEVEERVAETADARSMRPPTRARIGRGVAAPALYLLTSAAIFGPALLPHPGRAIVGLAAAPDPEIFIWSFAWWAHALGSLTNPFVSHAVYYPVGANLTWTASAPGLAVAFAPLTWLVGPTAGYNVAMILLPAVTAWTGFLLCRYLTASAWASVVGGYLFGFSTYVVSHEWGGEPNLTAFLVPLVALVVLRRVRGELPWWGATWRLGLLFAAQLTISTETTLTLSLALAAGLLLGYAFVGAYRGRIVRSLPSIAAAYPVGAAMVAPFVFYLASGFESGQFVGSAGGDLLNVVVPTRLTALGGSHFASVAAHFASNRIDSDLYIGVPTLLILGLFAYRRRREGSTWLLLVSFVLASVLALGAELELEGHKVLSLPWSAAGSFPVLPNVNPTRFAVYMALAASIGVALWTASTRGRFSARPVVLPSLALLSLVPAGWTAHFTRKPPRPEFFSRALYKICIPRGETLVIFPYGRFGDSMLYQAESGFWFNISEGNLGRDTYPNTFVFADPTVEALQFHWFDQAARPSMRQLKAYAMRRHVDRIVSTDTADYPNETQMNYFGYLQDLGGVAVAPACGHDSLAGDTRRIPGQ
jgi:hypothetical protein